MDAMTDKQLVKRWEELLPQLQDLPEDKHRHFALVLSKLAECYLDDTRSKAVLLVDTNDRLLTISIGATEMDCMEILNKAHEVMGMVVTSDAPEREMFN